MIRTILVPVDFSEHSRRALDYALRLAAELGSKVHVLHVVPEPWEYLPLEQGIWGEEAKEHSVTGKLVYEARRALDQLVANLPEENREKLESAVTTGTPYRVVLEATKSGQYDLVVMGTHGRTGLEHAMLGSVAERIVAHAGCPVLTIH